MVIDGITLFAVVRELGTYIEGAKIEKLYQPTRNEVLLHLHTKRGKQRLLLSASASDSRMYITQERPENPLRAPNFCMLLRKRLTNGRIAGISQMGLDRIVKIEIDAKDELGVPVSYVLYVELMAKHSNIILCGADEKILDSLRHVSFDTSSVRQVLPGMTYHAPPMDRPNPLELRTAEIEAAIRGARLPRGLIGALQGISPAVATEVCYRAFGDDVPSSLEDDADAKQLAQDIVAFLKEVAEQPNPCYQYDMKGMPVFYSPIPFDTYPKETRRTYKSMSEMLDAYYRDRLHLQRLEGLRARLQKQIQKQIARLEKKLTIQLETIQGGDDADKHLLYGELISANIYQLTRGMEKATLLNYYTNEEMEVPLDPMLTPAGNATKQFKRATKMKHGATLAVARAAEYEGELAFLYALAYDIDAAESFEDLADIRAEMQRYGYLQAEQGGKKQKLSDPLARPRQYHTSSGMRVLAGRNNRQNDVLTMRVASDQDVWFHAKGIPGSHVILFTGGKEPENQDLEEAAIIAATLSSGSGNTKVVVDYALRKHVWKPNGAKPGMVLYENQQSVNVSPNAQFIGKLEEICVD